MKIRYAQCWEDADVLLSGLDVKPGSRCLSIASAGDNSLALLARDPSHVLTIDMNFAQLACLELRVAAFRELDHAAVLELIGSRPSTRRLVLFAQCENQLSRNARSFWNASDNRAIIESGIGSGGKFENYFRLFRSRMLPLVHSRETISALVEPRSGDERLRFYNERWNTWRWRLLFRIFFSRAVMSRLGRDRAFFHQVPGQTAMVSRIFERVRYALTELDPSKNSYLNWILTGQHGEDEALPFSLRPENFDAIRNNLDRLEMQQGTLDDVLASRSGEKFDHFNLSDIFEYLPLEHCERLFEKICDCANPGARLAYWNMMVPRSRPDSLANRIISLPELSEKLHRVDRAFFYSRFVVEEIQY